MGCKRKRSKRNAALGSSTRRGKIWLDHIVDELLSYLDSEVAFLDPASETARERQFDDIDEELAQHLNYTRDDGKNSLDQVRNFSAKQVRAKLPRLYATRRRDVRSDDDWTVIYREGSNCIEWPVNSEREARIARRSKEIKHAWRMHFLHSPRKTRADSQIRGTPQNSPRRASRAPVNTTRFHGRMEGSSMASSHPLRQKRTIDESHHVKLLPFAHRTQLSFQVLDTESLATDGDGSAFIKVENVTQTPPLLLPRISNNEVEQDTPALRDSQDPSESEPEAFNTPLRGLSPVTCGNAASNKIIDRSRPSLVLMERLQEVEKELQTVKKDAALTIDFWKANYCKANDERAKFMKSKSALVVKLGNLRETGSNLSIDDLVNCQAVVDQLLDERDSQKCVQSLRCSTDTQPDDETMARVSKLMQDIGHRLESTLKNVKFTTVSGLRTLPQDHPLGSLFEQAFGIEWKSRGSVDLLERWYDRPWSRRYTLLTLAGAALACWVFRQTQADVVFDRYQGVATQSPTNRYREAIQLVAQNDPSFARAIDLVVHKRMTEEHSYEYFQRNKADDLARKLQHALAPLCQLSPCDEEETDGDAEVDEYAFGQLSDVFFGALDVQCRLVLTGWRYECAWYEPGAAFDKNTMTPYKVQDAGAADTSTVRLTLLPGIIHIPNSKVNADFGGFAERRRTGNEEVVCLVRSVVLRGSAGLH
ncbi:uncharacterized protein HMPREF1541_01432 [Cyphellophora europaea CBS 101466]|uniref:Uncharacterized protein n=1 Tax=Cyphellophora europaea (strain CBS 101466) TaxID=1220924 RepID=W2SF28_CYPE1|nr:uncharacterized protein HMPREF1541_01432 [Cyphellophora europaea CBS 101466]ETN47240.1 hypothetical protein HMPREF1541_01432 [Cyphellophora europaea CBS 101466]